MDAGRADALAVEERLIGLVANVRALEACVAIPMRRAVERAREFLASQPAGNHSLADIAAAAHCSAFHLARQFRRVNGIGLHAYRTRLRSRMAQALRRIKSVEHDLTALALDLGFSRHSHFTATFVRAFGVAPHDVRSNPMAPTKA